MPLSKTKFRYLTDEELSKYDDKNADHVREAKELDMKRFEKEQSDLSRAFVDRAQTVKRQSQSKNETDLEHLQRCIKECDNDTMAGLDLFLYQRADYRAEINNLNQNSRTHLNYQVTAARAGEDSFNRYHEDQKRFLRTQYTTDAPGVANTVDVNVAQSIMYRAEANGKILPRIAKLTVPYGEYEEPYYDKYGMAGYLAENGQIPDFNTDLADATDGIKKNKWEPKDFAYGLEQSFRSLTKLSPSILNDIFKFLGYTFTAGAEYQAVSGPGTGSTDSGIITVATDVAFNTNVYVSFVDACSEVGSKNVINKISLMNEKLLGEFKKLRATNMAYRDIIKIENGRIYIDEVEIIVASETVLPTVAGVSTLLVGDLEHFLIVDSGQLKEYNNSDPKNLTQFTAFHTTRHGQARFADSFTKVSVTL